MSLPWEDVAFKSLDDIYSLSFPDKNFYRAEDALKTFKDIEILARETHEEIRNLAKEELA